MNSPAPQHQEGEWEKEFDFWFLNTREPNDKDDYRKFIRSLLARERKAVVERIRERYDDAGVRVLNLVPRDGQLFVSLESTAPATVAFIDDKKFRAILDEEEGKPL